METSNSSLNITLMEEEKKREKSTSSLSRFGDHSVTSLACYRYITNPHVSVNHEINSENYPA